LQVRADVEALIRRHLPRLFGQTEAVEEWTKMLLEIAPPEATREGSCAAAEGSGREKDDDEEDDDDYEDDEDYDDEEYDDDDYEDEYEDEEYADGEGAGTLSEGLAASPGPSGPPARNTAKGPARQWPQGSAEAETEAMFYL
jgi:hypothetical protein